MTRIEQTINQVYAPLFTENKRYNILMGGRSGGRSFVASQYGLARLRGTKYFRCAIMRLVYNDIRNSIYQEFIDRIDEIDLYDELRITEKPIRIVHGTNRIDGIGFRVSSKDNSAKLKSLTGYNCVIIEEADEISEDEFIKLDDSLRTQLGEDIKIILLLNTPHKNHWIIKRWFKLDTSDYEGYFIPRLRKEHKDEVCFIHSTYKNNYQNINPKTLQNFKKYKETKPDHHRSMILGLVSEGARGRIFTDWQTISAREYEDLPFPVSYGLDFGFTNDPTALIEIKKHNNKLYFKELIYETGLTDKKLSEKMTILGVNKNALIVGDREPKSIRQLIEYGWNVVPAQKGSGSIRSGINNLLDYECYYTEDSKNVEDETLEYKWAVDRNKEPTNEPIDEFNHAIDAIRYNISYKKDSDVRVASNRVDMV